MRVPVFLSSSRTDGSGTGFGAVSVSVSDLLCLRLGFAFPKGALCCLRSSHSGRRCGLCPHGQREGKAAGRKGQRRKEGLLQCVLGYAEGWMGLERFCCDLSLTAKKAIFVTHCGYGVIGSRARLRIWCRKAWGFESLYPHKSVMAAEDKSQVVALLSVSDATGWAGRFFRTGFRCLVRVGLDLKRPYRSEQICSERYGLFKLFGKWGRLRGGVGEAGSEDGKAVIVCAAKQMQGDGFPSPCICLIVGVGVSLFARTRCSRGGWRWRSGLRRGRCVRPIGGRFRPVGALRRGACRSLPATAWPGWRHCTPPAA